MLILIKDNTIVGTTEPGNTYPDGFTVVEYPGSVDVRTLYFDLTEAKVKPIPPRPDTPPDSVTTWQGDRWVTRVRGEIKVSAKEAYMGSPLYKWAKARALQNPSIMLSHITAMCADVGDIRDELRDAVKELRDLRNAEQNSVKTS